MKKLTVLFVALVMVFAALPAFAQDKADWAFYGHARMWTSWESVDENTLYGGSGGSQSRGWNPGFGLSVQDDDGLTWGLQTNSRLGANVKWGNIGGTVEFGNAGGAAGADFGTTWRLIYGTWDFGAGKLTVGKDFTPYLFFVSGMCGPGGGECVGIGFGTIYGQRRAQLKLTMGGFKFALVDPTATINPWDSTTAVTIAGRTAVARLGVNDFDKTLPRIEASYTFNLGPAALFIGGMYNTYDAEVARATGVQDISMDSFVLGLGARTAFGPFYANASFQYGENVGDLGMPTNLLFTGSMVDGVTFAQEDAEYMAAQLILGFKVTDAFALEAGVIWQSAELDVPNVPTSTSVDQDTYAYYLQAVWSPAKNFFIVPEVGIINNGDLDISGQDQEDLGDVTWFGIKWQINF